MKLRLRTAHFVAALALAAIAAGAIGWIDRVPARYFPENEVDRKAYPLRRIDLPYPDDRQGVDYYGTLRMELRINERGDVDRVQVLGSTLPPRYRDACVKAFATARFEPALREGRKVKSVKRVEVRFAPPVRGLGRDS
ncbi:MAG TPA: TonB family protein [Usitatibacter sp.]|nr:TonB family protein [Usitatibacter sp.]